MDIREPQRTSKTSKTSRFLHCVRTADRKMFVQFESMILLLQEKFTESAPRVVRWNLSWINTIH